MGLSHLCEFIEDCEFTFLSVQVRGDAVGLHCAALSVCQACMMCACRGQCANNGARRVVQAA
jgi:hypothetical protein